MFSLFKSNFRHAAGVLGAGIMLAAAAPAAANTSTNAAADVAEPIREAQSDSLTSGDPRFRQLFASWSALDSAGPGSPMEQPTVAVPSRMPLAGARMTSDYGMRNHPVLRKRARHNGVDLAAPTGTPIYATADGVIGRADWFSSYGLYISIDHGADLETRYAHMSRLAVAAGEYVQKGDVIGYVGSTGRSTGPHLHYEVRVDGVAVNPIPYMVETEMQLAASTDSGLTGAGGK
ncbi:M23 family metallopeptidase [Erythrobacter sp. MTPC3]|uniref:M23 family metallopeptidase n=1 Tax=Erythrobacter sp. MTPC3 TaxID=3056564 RepID=UPI0036F1A28D